MIEIVFSESACGSLKIAQRFGEGRFCGCAVSVGVIGAGREGRLAALIQARRRARRAWESAVPLGGDPADVYGFDLALSVGDLAEDMPGVRRRQVLERLRGFYPGAKEAAAQSVCAAAKAIEAVCRRAAAGESVRIWYSSQPDEHCGLYWAIEQLWRANACNGPVWLVSLPGWEADEARSAVERSCWGEMPPEGWHRHVGAQRLAPRALCRAFAARYRALREENAPLRATVNGRLLSVPETFYDGLIEKEIAAQGAAIDEAAVIGNVLGKYRPGVGDGYLALRIEAMLRAGKLSVLQEAPAEGPAYGRLLARVQV